MPSHEKEDFLTALGATIRSYRQNRGMSLDELAKRCGYTSENSRSTMQKIESGKNDIPTSRLRKIAETLGVSASALLDSSIDMQRHLKESKTCNLFEECYGKDAYNVVSRFLKLDDEDRARVSERIDTLLEQDKYVEKRQEERSSSYEITAADA